MKTEIEHLLTPRYKVIALYPHTELAVGDIIHLKSENTYIRADKTPCGGVFIEEIEKYPHLFKPLNWWEYREIGEMPKYLKFKTHKGTYNYFQVAAWVISGDEVYFDAIDSWGTMDEWEPKNTYQPCTLKEYLKHLQNQTK